MTRRKQYLRAEKRCERLLSNINRCRVPALLPLFESALADWWQLGGPHNPDSRHTAPRGAGNV